MSRPRSSVSGSYSAMHGSNGAVMGKPEIPRATTPGPRLGHAFSRSVSAVNGHNYAQQLREGGEDCPTPLTARRTTMDRTGILAPGSIARRQSGGVGGLGPGRRQSGAASSVAEGEGEMRPPSSKGRLRMSGVGETF
jgi:hypothetical protein